MTLAAYRHVYANVDKGMSGGDIAAMMSDATRALGGRVRFSMALLNESTAYPHGSNVPQVIEEGSIIPSPGVSQDYDEAKSVQHPRYFSMDFVNIFLRFQSFCVCGKGRGGRISTRGEKELWLQSED